MYDPARDIFKSEDHTQASDEADDDSRNEPIASHEVTSAKVNREGQTAEGSKGEGSVEETEQTQAANKTKSNSRPQSEERTAKEQEVSTTTSPEKMKKRRRSGSPEVERASPSEKPIQDKSMAQSKNETEAQKDDEVPSASKKRRKLSSAEADQSTPQFPAPMPLDKLPRFSRKNRDAEDQRKPRMPRRDARERSRSPRSRESRRENRERSRSPTSRKRARSPDRDRRGNIREERRSRSPISRRRARSPGRDRHVDSRDERRSPPRRRIRSRSPLRRPSPPRPRSPSRSPPRKLKRPGGAARISAAEKEALRKRQQERLEEQTREAQREAAIRGTQDVVREHYNAVPERGREWRKTDSTIRGLRSFNNWVKSTIIQKFSPKEGHRPGDEPAAKWAEGMDGGGLDADHRRGLLVLDIGCGKGGDLGKWQLAPQPVELYVGIDPADVSIEQARERYRQMRRGGRGNDRRPPPPSGRGPRDFHAEFFVKDAFAEWLGDIPFIREVGIDEGIGSRWSGGSFDVCSMMFSLHYAFESEEKVRGMLRNIAGSLKKGARFLGAIPNSDVITQKVIEHHRRRELVQEDVAGSKRDAEGNVKETEETESSRLEWGNSIYRVQFPEMDLPKDGIFRPPFGWKYNYFLEEAVEGVPEYVVPWEAFRALTEEYNLELQYRRPFPEIWKEEKDDPILGPLSERMGVRGRGRGPLLVSDEEMDAASFYVAFCFYKV